MSCANDYPSNFPSKKSLSFSHGAGYSVTAPMSEVTRVLGALNRGESQAAEDLLPLVYDELRKLASIRMAMEAPNHTFQPTLLAHEAWLRLTGGVDQCWENRMHFLAAASEAMRRILIEHARRRLRLKRGGNQQHVDLDHVELISAIPDDKLLLVHEALEQLEREDARKARVVLMKFFGGMTNLEIAHVLGVTERTVDRQWAYAKAWLFQKIRCSG